MKKGKKIWNRLLSLVLCLVMVTGVFAGMGMEAKAADRPDSSGGQSYGRATMTWALEPDNTGEQFYEKVKSEVFPYASGYGGYKTDLTYITERQNASTGGFFWNTECKNKTFEEKTYYVYAFCHTVTGQPTVMHEYIINVKIGYTLGISISGASGSVNLGGKTYSSGSFVAGKNSDVSFTVNSITDYTPTVTFGDTTLSGSNGTYTISSNNIKNASDRTIRVEYTLENPSTITIQQNENATISFNGKTDSSQTVGKSGTYSISVNPKQGYKVTGIFVDGDKIASGNSASWTPSSPSHTISATVEKKQIGAKGGEIVFRENMSMQEVAEAVFNEIYDEVNSDHKLKKEDIIVSRSGFLMEPYKYACIRYKNNENLTEYMLVSSIMGHTNLGLRFGDEAQEEVQLYWARYADRFIPNESPDEEYQSPIVTLTINKIQVEAKSPLTKVYDGNPMTLSTATAENPDFKWSGNEGNIVSLSIVGHYDSEKIY